MSDPRHRHPYDCIAFLDQRWDAMTAEMRAKAVQVEAELHMRIAALTSELAEARAERDSLAETRAALTANLNALTIELGESRSELAEARRQLGEAETRIATYQAERDLACAALADTARERDALLDMARDVSVYAATSARHGSERSMRDVLTMTANRARSFLLPKSAHGAGEAK